MPEIAPTRKNWKDREPNPFRVLFPEVTAWGERGAPVRTIWIYVVLTALAFFLYLPVAWHDFVALGDHEYVRDNGHINSGLTFGNILWAFRAERTGIWQPLTWLSHMRDCQFFEMTAAWHLFVLVPEPSIYILFGLGALAGLQRFRRKKS